MTSSTTNSGEADKDDCLDFESFVAASSSANAVVSRNKIKLSSQSSNKTTDGSTTTHSDSSSGSRSSRRRRRGTFSVQSTKSCSPSSRMSGTPESRTSSSSRDALCSQSSHAESSSSTQQQQQRSSLTNSVGSSSIYPYTSTAASCSQSSILSNRSSNSGSSSMCSSKPSAHRSLSIASSSTVDSVASPASTPQSSRRTSSQSEDNSIAFSAEPANRASTPPLEVSEKISSQSSVLSSNNSNSPTGRGRTKNQRLRLLKESRSSAAVSSSQDSSTTASSSPSRHVRFSAAAATAVDQPSRRKTQHSSPPRRRRSTAASSSGRRTTAKKSRDWLDAMVNSSSSLNDNDRLASVPEHGSAAPTEQAKPRKHTCGFAGTSNARPPRPPSRPTLRKLKKADLYSIQDAGTYQMLRDECLFLCSSIVVVPSTSSTLMPLLSSTSSPSTSSQPLEAAFDLLNMLSSRQNRRALLTGGSDHFQADESPLQALCGVFAWAKQLVVVVERNHHSVASDGPLIQESSQSGPNSTLPTNRDVASSSHVGRTSGARKKQSQQDTTTTTVSSTAPSPAHSVSSTIEHHHHQQRRSKTTTRQMLNAIAMMAYFVSVDCTMSSEAACANGAGASKEARRVRRALLTNAECLQGLLSLVLADPLTEQQSGESMTIQQGGDSGADRSSSIVTGRQNIERNPCDDRYLNVTSPSSTIGTPQSQSSSGSVDPTAEGRLRRKRRRLLQAQLDSGVPDQTSKTDTFSFTSDSPAETSLFADSDSRRTDPDGDVASIASSIDSRAGRTGDRLDLLFARILGDRGEYKNAFSDGEGSCRQHSCGVHDDSLYISSTVPLLVLSRIISGKMDDNERSCIDDDNGQDEEVQGDDADYNPLLWTNTILAENEAIPLLAQALSSTMVSVFNLIESCDTRKCRRCLFRIQDRVSKLGSLVDGASLLSESNRQQFCEEGYRKEFRGCLAISLVSVLDKMIQNISPGKTMFHGILGEIALSVLRMMTSLTHDNRVAATELTVPLATMDEGSRECETERCGITIISELLCLAVLADGTDKTEESKMTYDSIIFCLNILANAVEGGVPCQKLAEIKVSRKITGESVVFLTWLSRWLVEETKSFRDAVVESTFGSSPSKHTERKLDDHEDERLVTAGNGFVLLSCLLVDEQEHETNGDSSAYQLILHELPGANRDSKISYLKNTLKAFCNFYHYSVGDLSVAIVAPVKQLIKRLEKIQEQRHRLSLEC